MITEARMMTASAITRREEALKHYGVLGMKWGIRRYQPYGHGGYTPEEKGRFVGKRGKIQKALNKNDKQRAQFQDSVTISGRKSQRYYNEADRYERMGNTSKAAKLRTKGDTWKIANEDYSARLEEAKAKTKELLQIADESGFDVRKTAVQHNVRKGQNFVAAYTGGFVGYVAAKTAAVLINDKDDYEAGTKYNLKKRKEGIATGLPENANKVLYTDSKADKKTQAMADAIINGNEKEYYKIRNSMKTGEEKDRAVREAEKIALSSTKNRFPGNYTAEGAKVAAEKARKNYSFDMTFLEIVQNDSRNENRSWLQKEYEKYLQDGIDDYWKKYDKYAKRE